LNVTSKVLITGASGGFGKLTAMSLLERGHKVVASMRDVAGKNRKSAENFTDLGASVVEMDVTEDHSVAAGVAWALEALDGLDVVVNNAGLGVLGVQETFTPEDWLGLFNVNVFGVQRVNRAVLPHMRGKRAGLLVGSVQKTVPDQAETIDFSSLKPGFTQNSDPSLTAGLIA